MPRRESTKAHWQAFWTQDVDVDDVYSNDGRIVTEIERVTPLDGLRVLEVGAGSGRDALDCDAAGAWVVTVDYTRESLRIVREHARRRGRRVHLVCADATRLPFRDGSLDVVFHQGLMEHFRDPRPLLAENRRVLRTGGHLLVDVPQRWHPYTAGKHILIWFGRWFAGWETEYSIGELERLVRQAGFAVRHAYGNWMVPGLWYRVLRRVLLGTGLRLPMYPRYGALGDRLAAWRARWRRRRWAFYTFLVIGVIGEKHRDEP
ncbi:MAG: class I SAM-dependent methyltransferase [Candidatus Eiseniibacteriota bacterium]|jgi:SAM-dependent methyltransferase